MEPAKNPEALSLITHIRKQGIIHVTEGLPKIWKVILADMDISKPVPLLLIGSKDENEIYSDGEGIFLRWVTAAPEWDLLNVTDTLDELLPPFLWFPQPYSKSNSGCLHGHMLTLVQLYFLFEVQLRVLRKEPAIDRVAQRHC